MAGIVRRCRALVRLVPEFGLPLRSRSDAWSYFRHDGRWRFP